VVYSHRRRQRRAKRDAFARCAPRLYPYWLVYATAAYPGCRPRGPPSVTETTGCGEPKPIFCLGIVRRATVPDCPGNGASTPIKVRTSFGKASHVVFDKTGTLTEDELSVVGENYLSEPDSHEDIPSIALGLAINNRDVSGRTIGGLIGGAALRGYDRLWM
jgi:hypothetical protein